MSGFYDLSPLLSPPVFFSIGLIYLILVHAYCIAELVNKDGAFSKSSYGISYPYLYILKRA